MIRRLTEEDREIYIEMADEFYHSDAVLHPIPRSYIENTADEALRGGTYTDIYMICYKEETAGYAVTAKTYSQEAGGYVIWIEELYIKEEFRSKGLGREFFSYIERKAEGFAARLRLEVEADNKRAVSLYERLGYQVLEYVQMVREV